MFKKIFKRIALILCAIIPVITVLAACSDAGAPNHAVSDPEFAISAEDMAAELESFISANENRTSFSREEAAAAEYLNGRLSEFGYEPEIHDFKATENNVQNLTSQNVVARYGSDNDGDDVKNVIIGAYYDNRYASAYKGANVYGSAGALANGTGVAALLKIAEYLKVNSVKLDFDVTIVFFGASFVTDVGAEKYYNEHMEPVERKNTVLMIELQRLGTDHVYAFSDARETSRETFFDGIAADNGLDIYKVTQKSPLMTGVSALDGVPYFQWAHSGLFGPFFNAGIPTLNLVGANWETFDFNDNESYKNDNIAYGKNDTLQNLTHLYPDFGSKMATAATLVIKSLENESFLGVMTSDKNNFPDTGALTKLWIWYLIVLCVIIVAAAALIAVSTHLIKKYPVSLPKPLRMKMAVFGMEYEDKSSSDMFIDLQPNDAEEIFPGIENNKPGDNSLDDVFPPLFDGTHSPSDPPDPFDNGGADDSGDDGSDNTDRT